MEYISQHADLLGDKALKPLRACSGLLHPVVAVTTETIAIDAFERMLDKVYSAAPAVLTASPTFSFSPAIPRGVYVVTRSAVTIRYIFFFCL